jgi:predicted dehydrogenase
MINIGVIGYGYWGPNIVRNFNARERAKVVTVCDSNEKSLDRVKLLYSDIETTTNYDDIISSPHINAVAVITPVFTHYELSKKALEAGKHVFVEKPFTATVEQAEELIEIAEKKNLTIMVDHTFLFTGAVKKTKELINNNILGDILYYDSTRVNLGLFQHDINVIWDLAPHDLSIMDYIITEKPTALVATGQSHFNNNLEDIAYITIYFSHNIIAHINVNWLSPVKVRQTLIGGQKKMLVWNDLEADEKIKVYDKGVEISSAEGVYDLLVSYRSGDMWSPTVSQTEALQTETGYFLDCVINNKKPINDGHAGLRVVRFLEAADESLKKKGESVYL